MPGIWDGCGCWTVLPAKSRSAARNRAVEFAFTLITSRQALSGSPSGLIAWKELTWRCMGWSIGVPFTYSHSSMVLSFTGVSIRVGSNSLPLIKNVIPIIMPMSMWNWRTLMMITSVANRGVQVQQALLAVNRDYAFHVADALVAGASTSSQRKCCSDTDINSYRHARIRFY